MKIEEMRRQIPSAIWDMFVKEYAAQGRGQLRDTADYSSIGYLINEISWRQTPQYKIDDNFWVDVSNERYDTPAVRKVLATYTGIVSSDLLLLI